jgi:hypothetical protein
MRAATRGQRADLQPEIPTTAHSAARVPHNPAQHALTRHAPSVTVMPSFPGGLPCTMT